MAQALPGLPSLLHPAPASIPWVRALPRLENLRAFARTPIVEGSFDPPAPDAGQWLVIVGENGVGKTTLLRALALALVDPAVANKLLDERAPLLRKGTEGHVSVTTDAGTLSVRLHRSGRLEQVEAIAPVPDRRPWVVGYGVRRGDARGEEDRAVEIGAVGELHTLFDRPAALHRAPRWLAEAEANAIRARVLPGGEHSAAVAIWEAAQTVLCSLLNLKAIAVRPDGTVWVTHRHLGEVRLDNLSDGYLSTAGWVIDLVARWLERQDELGEPLSGNLLGEMRGFVLIDEIDLHLHPAWQLHILDDLRRLFPRLSFIATTHNPLCLQGAHRGEIYRMERLGHDIHLRRVDRQPGSDADRILLEQFGLLYTEDAHTRELLRRHRAMLEGVNPDPAARAQLEGEIAARLGADAQPNQTPLSPDEQALLDAIEEEDPPP